MKLTPQDILTQQFGSKVKGYDKDEVKNFLIQVVETLENEIQEKKSGEGEQNGRPQQGQFNRVKPKG